MESPACPEVIVISKAGEDSKSFSMTNPYTLIGRTRETLLAQKEIETSSECKSAGPDRDGSVRQQRSSTHSSPSTAKTTDKWLDATVEDGSFGRLLNDNHRRPNLTVKVLEVEGELYPAFFAQRDIVKGEELTYNYGGNSSRYWWRKKVVNNTGIKKKNLLHLDSLDSFLKNAKIQEKGIVKKP